jgi:hypothetical protein
MRLAWGGTTHTDPGPGFPWDHLAASIKAAQGATATTQGDDEMIGFAIDDNGKLRKSAGGFTFPSTEQERQDLLSLSKQGVVGPVSEKIWPNDATGTAFGYPIEQFAKDVAKLVSETAGPGPTVDQVVAEIVDRLGA